jgi:XTP/dITP diphosphohydrolase/ATP diphosphatase
MLMWSALFAGYSIDMDLKAGDSKLKATIPDEIEPRNTGSSHGLDSGKVFAESVAIMARLRGPDGCPWDREQSFDSIRRHTLEEAYEVLDAIERRDWPHLKEELGDLMLQVLFYAQMGSELAEGRFTIADVMETLNQKLIRRHPHVFGEAASAAAGNRAVVDAAVDGSASRVLANWEEIKKSEKSAAVVADGSMLDQVMRAQPALSEAGKLGSKAAKVGFDWPDWRDLLAKLEEETAELVEAADSQGDPVRRMAAIESEVGDLLFTAVNLGRHLGVDAEMALRGTNLRFRSRFREMEIEARDSLGTPLDELKPQQLEALWVSAKKRLAGMNEGSSG